MELRKLLASVDEQNQRSIGDAIRDGLDIHMFSTLKFYGKLCTTDGHQFIELMDIFSENIQAGVDLPKIIQIPEGGAEVTVLETGLAQELRNIAIVAYTTGAPMEEVELWTKVVLFKHGRDIVGPNQTYDEAMALVLTLINKADHDQLWLMNACFYYAGEALGVGNEQLAVMFASWPPAKQHQFLVDTAQAMGLKVKE